jgi:hypothetical protein
VPLPPFVRALVIGEKCLHNANLSVQGQRKGKKQEDIPAYIKVHLPRILFLILLHRARQYRSALDM